MLRDSFDCIVEKDVTTEYWKTTVKDYYVENVTTIPDPVGAPLVSVTTETLKEDYVPTLKNNAQDWFVFEQDEKRDEEDNLCKKSSLAGFQCEQIRCVLRRKMNTENLTDMQFAPTGAANASVKMQFPKYKSYLSLNQGTFTVKKQLRNLKDTEIVILQGAFNSLAASSALAIATITALIAF